MVLVVSNSRSPHYLLMLKKRFSILSECIDICFFERPKDELQYERSLRM